MKLWITILLLLFVPFYITTPHQPFLLEELPVVEQLADFRITYEYIRKQEGYYANVQYDRGGITYAGITKKYNPNWYGWRYIPRNLKHNEKVEAAELWVLDFYLDIWVKEGFYKLTDQKVANYLFDTRIHFGQGGTFRLLRKMDVPLVSVTEWVQGEYSSMSIEHLRVIRLGRYYELTRKDPTQRKFLKNWVYRANTIKEAV